MPLVFDREKYYKTICRAHEKIEKRQNLVDFLDNQNIYYGYSNNQFARDQVSVDVAETLKVRVQRGTEMTKLRPEIKKFCKQCLENEQKIAERLLPTEELGTSTNDLAEIF